MTISISPGSRADLERRIAAIVDALGEAESFISGFEDDDTQEEPVDDMLERIRAAIALAETALVPPASSTLAIVIEGGMISAIVSDRPALFADIEVLVIDYDTDNTEGSDAFVAVPQSDGTKEDAHVEPWPVDRAKIDLAAVTAALDARDDAKAEG